MPQKYTYEEVCRFFDDNGCKLLSTKYINSKSKLNYICTCGNEDIKTFNRFKEGQRCKQCGVEKAHKNTRYSFEFVKQTFEENNCMLLSVEYKNGRQKLDYICSCGNKAEITFSEFIKGSRCAECGYKKTAEKLSFSQEKVEQIFLDANCKLLSQYKNSSTKLKFQCECGNISHTILHAFMNGTRCKECGIKKTKEKQSHNYGFIKREFEKEGCILLSEEYINTMTHLDYICSCGNRSSITYNNFKKDVRCYDCSGKTRWDFISVKQYFKDNNCELLSKEYLNAHQVLDYICECGRQSTVRFANFQNGARCKKCASEKQSGENNYNWNGGISTISQYLRGQELDWKKQSMKNCNYKCVLTGERFDVIHHLYGFNKIVYKVLGKLGIELGIKDTVNNLTDEQLDELKQIFLDEINNYPLGVCLTEEVHRLFHSEYGYGNNTPEQFEEFKVRYKNGEFNNKQSISIPN